MQLLTIEDPRDNLQKATRWELIDFAKANGIDIPGDAPAIYTMKVLRSRGLTNIKIPNRPLGMNAGAGEVMTDEAFGEGADATVVNADDDLIRQFESQKAETDVSKMLMPDLRKACKARGIKMARTDNLKTLREKLSGQ